MCAGHNGGTTSSGGRAARAAFVEAGVAGERSWRSDALAQDA